MANFISISLDVPGALSRVSKGGLQWNSEALEKNLLLARERIQVAITSAIRDGSKETKEVAVREFAAKLRCDRRLIEKRITTERVTIYRARGTVRILARRIDLKHFNPTQQKKGVSVTTDKARFYRRAFGPNVPRLGGNVFVRDQKSRLPIKKIPGVSLVNVADSSGITHKLEVYFRTTVRRKIKENLTRLVLFRSNYS